MSSTAAEVAEDYREALEDLTANSRFEISNLTVVARENTEHALAIAECLQEHIKKVPPQRKLPALYVLDSIVKNVGTPYTLFFGRKLYGTFMDAYASVDNQTRRKMDEMLKTWKEPVPGSIDTRPVFPPDVVRPIENALIKARTTALQAQQESIRGQQALLSGRRQQPPPPYRETPTPPGFRPGSHQPLAYGQHPPPGMNGHPQGPPIQQSYPILSNNTPQPQYASRSTPQAGYPGYQPPPAPDAYHQQQPPQAGLSIDKLKNDIQQLIAAAKAEFAAVPHDTSVQTRLRALLDLQGVMQHQNLNQDQLALVRNQVAELSSAVNHINNNRAAPPQAAAASAPALPLPLPAYSTPTPVPHPVAVAPPPAPSVSAPPVAATSAPGGAGAVALSLDALFGQGALATLLAGAKTGTPVNATPTPQPPPVAAIRSPAPSLAQPAQPPATAAGPPADPMALMAMLRQSGLLRPPSSSAPPGGGGTVAVHPPPPPPPPVSVPGGIDLASILAKANAVAHHATPAAPPPSVFSHLTADIQLKSSSLKKFRPHLIPLLHDDLGPPCTQCGRRFRTDTDAGRRKKTAHMDWHFRVHQRIAEAEKRGQHRSWYVDADDWVSSREAVDTDYVAPVTDISSTDDDDDDGGQRHGGEQSAAHRGAATGAGKGSARRGKVAYIPVPEDGRVNTVCPICQEKFEMKWLDEAQEWVWMDAVRVGERAYHASCYGEATKGGGGGGGSGGHTPVARGFTPEPVLGKRKAEVSSYF
ncbi:hypothetical protein GE09DRAFT_42926 [Coniochaeta sp. 2T2.1]|nr:hypothetical protein GE09DRAFT_42926 [Coniochaeta sp. 2T2.1]